VIAVLDAPSVLGLRPPAPGKVPGALRLPEALRTNRLLERLGAGDAGRVDPPPTPPSSTRHRGPQRRQHPGYSVALADRLGELLRDGHRELGPIADEVLATPMTLFDVAELRRLGPAETAGRAAADLTDTVVAGLRPRAA
jgi:hypothetical protein